MKIKDSIDLKVLLDYQFVKVNENELFNEDEFMFPKCDYVYTIGHARRGQFYYLLVSEKDREIKIFASKPDGAGGSVVCPDILIDLVKSDVVY